MHGLLLHLLQGQAQFRQWYMGSLAQGGYPLIVLLMAMESSIIPIPAELVVPQAAYLAHVQGNLTPVGVALAATLGSWLGATIMYWGSRWVGRPLIMRFGRYILIPQAKVEHAERWTARFGPVGVFISRLVPVIRHLIGIPAGILRLGYGRYSLYTIAGSLIWCSVLTAAGVIFGRSPDLRTLTALVAGLALIMGGLYYFLVYRGTREPAAV